jgi:PAS domain S-box-containing protein
MHSPVPFWRSVKARVTLSMLAISLASLWSLSYFASSMLHKDMERLLGEQQFSAVSVVAAQINSAVESHFKSLDIVASTMAQTMRQGPAATQARLDQLLLLPTLFNGGVLVHRLDGTVIAEAPVSAGRIGVNYMEIGSVAAALRKGEPGISEPVLGKVVRAPVIGMTVPIRDAQGRVIGAVSGLTHLALPNFLDNVSKGSYGKAGGYMLVAVQYRRVVTATNRQRIMEKLPPAGSIPLVDRFIQGYEGSGVVHNPQGQEVLASAKAIPAAGWYLAAALPTAEAYAPIHDMHQRMLLATILLTLLACALTWWMIRRQLAPMLAAARTLASYTSGAGDLPQILPISRQDEIGQLLDSFNRLLVAFKERKEALRKSERFKDVILNSMAAHIAVLDQKGVIQAVNEPWRRFSLENGIEPGQAAPHTQIGVDYLAVVRRAIGGSPMAQAEEAYQGIQAVLAGKLPAYSNEYPCHSQNRKRWFTMNVMPLGQEKQEGVVITHTDITAIKQAEEERRIAAVAFECQEGMIITDAKMHILRTNHSFTRIMGYSNEEVLGRPTTFMRSDRHPPGFYENAWHTAREQGIWNDEVWHTRKNGEVFPQWLTCTAVKDEQGVITNYVVTHTDITFQKQQEARRLADETAHRNALVREVHHRIKNNLQGISGLLRLFAQAHPQTTEAINQVMSQIRSIAVLHGLQGHASLDTVRLCELTSAIATDVQSVWQTPIAVDIPALWTPGIIAEKEAVPIALVLNELLVNAVKHGGKAHGHVSVTLRKGEDPETIQVSIRNSGHWRDETGATTSHHAGLQLIASLMPREGARLTREQLEDEVLTRLEISPPVLHLEEKTA